MRQKTVKQVGAVAGLALALAGTALAGRDEDKLVRDVIAAAAESYAKDRVAAYITFRVGSSAMPLGQLGAGTAAFATIDLASSLYDLSQADNDKQRAYAGSRAGIAGYALLGGPAAPVLAVAIVAASLIEAGLAARDQAEMLRILEQIQRNVNRVIEIERLLIEADAVQYRYLLATSTSALADHISYAAQYKNNCATQIAIQTLGALDECVAALGRSVLAAQLFVDTVESLQQLRKGSGALFVELDAKLGYDEKDLEASRAAATKMLADVKPVFDTMLQSFAQATAKLMISGALDSAAFPTSEWVHMSCIEQAMLHSRQGTTLLVQARVLGKQVTKSKLASYRRAVDLYEASICTKVTISTPFSAVLQTWNTMVRNTRRDVLTGPAK